MTNKPKTAADYPDSFDYNPELGTWFTKFREQMAFISCSTDINIAKMTYEEALIHKPCYLAVMASRKQLQPILDNPHLFDPAFINAIHLLFKEYDDVKIEQS